MDGEGKDNVEGYWEKEREREKGTEKEVNIASPVFFE